MSTGGRGSCKRDRGEAREMLPVLSRAVEVRTSCEALLVGDCCFTSLGWSCWQGHRFSDSVTCLGASWSFCICVSLGHHMVCFSNQFSLQHAVRCSRFDWTRGSAQCSFLGLIELRKFCIIFGIGMISRIKQKPRNPARFFSPFFCSASVWTARSA